MPAVKLRQARKHLHQWVTEQGETTVITRHGRPVDQQVPVEADTWSPALLRYLDGEPPPGEELVMDRNDLLPMPRKAIFD